MDSQAAEFSRFLHMRGFWLIFYIATGRIIHITSIHDVAEIRVVVLNHIKYGELEKNFIVVFLSNTSGKSIFII